MTEIKFNPSTIVEQQKALQEAIQLETSKLENPALERAAMQPVDLDKDVRQAYDRMHHTHNRS